MIQIALCQIVKSAKNFMGVLWGDVPNVLECLYLMKALAMIVSYHLLANKHMQLCTCYIHNLYSYSQLVFLFYYLYYFLVDCGIPNCILCDRVDNKCIQCKEGYQLTSDGRCEGKHYHNRASCIQKFFCLLAIIQLAVQSYLSIISLPNHNFCDSHNCTKQPQLGLKTT